MGIFRTKETQDKYDEYRKTSHFKDRCGLCEDVSLKEFKYWKIMKVLFPLDKIAEVDHMILPKRHIQEKELTQEEKDEFQEIKHGYLNENYDMLMEATTRKKSIPAHFHIHLILMKG